MPISFANDAHRLAYDKIQAYLGETELIYDRYLEEPWFRLRKGSATVLVEVLDWPSGITVLVICPVVLGARVDDPALLRHLLGLNARRTIGGFATGDDGTIFFKHAIPALSCTRSQLYESVVDVLTVSDEQDDEIVTKWGGQRLNDENAAPGTVPAVAPASTDGGASSEPQREVLEPTGKGIGDGKAFYFLFGFRKEHAGDQAMLAEERLHLGDDVATLRAAGYRVVLEPAARARDLLDAVYGKGEGAEGLPTAGIFWSGHGAPDGGLQTADEGTVRPPDVATDQVSSSLRAVVLASCYVGRHSRSWRKALGGRPLVLGWGKPLTLERAAEFLDPTDAGEHRGLGEVLRSYLLADTPVPAEVDDAAVITPSVLEGGTVEGFVPRLTRVAQILHADVTPEARHALFAVPVEAGGTRTVRAALVSSAERYLEGEPLLAVEADVGDLTAAVDVGSLLGASRGAGYAKVAAIKGDAEMPRVVIHGFLPVARTRDQDLAAMICQVAERADLLSRRIFGNS